MKLNRFERLLMASPLRAAMQRRYDAPILRRLGGPLPGGRVLEVGCGRGIGVEVLRARFGAEEITAFDLDPDVVREARDHAAAMGIRVRLAGADVTAIPFGDGAFDAVFDFGALHHVVEWRLGVREIRRVLRLGGAFYFMEVTRRSLDRWIVRLLTDHPREDRFGPADLAAELRRHGIECGDAMQERWPGDLVYGVGRVVDQNGHSDGSVL